MPRRPTVHRVVATTTFVLTCCIGSPARSAVLDVPAALGLLDTASVATVVLVPPMAIFRASLDQGAFGGHGCHYTTADAAAIRRLVALVRAGSLTTNPVFQRPDVREGIYFSLADGSKLSVFIADNAGGRLPVLGLVETAGSSQFQSVSVTARPAMPTELREWARRDGGVGTGSTCNQQSATATEPVAPTPLPDQR